LSASPLLLLHSAALLSCSRSSSASLPLQADEVEKTLDRIAKNSNTKVGLKDALEEDDD
jgi:hypothetical protein